jgi:hypothetical protein
MFKFLNVSISFSYAEVYQNKHNHYESFKNSLIIHEENTKKNHKRVVSLYVDKDSLHLHKL